jgi:hypothetical protein
VYRQLVIQRCTALSIPDGTYTQYGPQYLDKLLICFWLIKILKARIYLITGKEDFLFPEVKMKIYTSKIHSATTKTLDLTLYYTHDLKEFHTDIAANLIFLIILSC